MALLNIANVSQQIQFALSLNTNYKMYMKLVTLLTSALLIGCSSQKIVMDKQVLKQRLVMGTVISARLQQSESRHFEIVFKIFSDLDKVLSTYKKDSDVSKLNRQQSIEPKIQTVELLKLTNYYNKITEGHFNIYTGKQSFMARKSKMNLYLKPMSLKAGSYHSYSNNKLKLISKHQLDFGGVAKGYAIDKSIKYLKSQKVSSAQIIASGDIGCLGPCSAFIQNPVNENPMLELRSQSRRLAISTSRTNRRATLSKVINPLDGKFVNHWLSVTLLADNNNTQLDALATAVFSMPYNKAFSYLKKNRIHYIIVDRDKRLFISDQIGQVLSDIKYLDIKNISLQRRFTKPL